MEVIADYLKNGVPFDVKLGLTNEEAVRFVITFTAITIACTLAFYSIRSFFK